MSKLNRDLINPYPSGPEMGAAALQFIKWMGENRNHCSIEGFDAFCDQRYFEFTQEKAKRNVKIGMLATAAAGVLGTLAVEHKLMEPTPTTLEPADAIIQPGARTNTMPVGMIKKEWSDNVEKARGKTAETTGKAR